VQRASPLLLLQFQQLSLQLDLAPELLVLALQRGRMGRRRIALHLPIVDEAAGAAERRAGHRADRGAGAGLAASAPIRAPPAAPAAAPSPAPLTVRAGSRSSCSRQPRG
jgi:hypothetical protein